MTCFLCYLNFLNFKRPISQSIEKKLEEYLFQSIKFLFNDSSLNALKLNPFRIYPNALS